VPGTDYLRPSASSISGFRSALKSPAEGSVDRLDLVRLQVDLCIH
jgi:hypothetical protein